MKIFATAAIVQALLLVTGARGTAAAQSKLVTCFYFDSESVFNGALNLENIDASICSHLVVGLTTLTNIIREKEESLMRPSNDSTTKSFEGLKAENPDLKLILQTPFWYLRWIQIISGSPGTSNITQNAMNFLREMGFDGFDFSLDMLETWAKDIPEDTEEVVDVICEMKPEFDKHGYIISTTSKLGHLPERQALETYNYTKLARCCDHIKVSGVSISTNATERLSSLSRIKSSVDLYIERGFQPNKILIYVPTVGTLHPVGKHRSIGVFEEMTVYEPNKIGEYVISGALRGSLKYTKTDGFILHKNLMREMKNSSLGWTIRRDEDTKEPYAFTKTGLWAFYEDKTSMEAKARYVLEKGLGGIAIFLINSEDSEGTEGEGRFPLTRAVFNAFKELQTGGKTSQVIPDTVMDTTQ